MKLTAIRFENVGGFQTAELNLDGNRLLVGENNSGKTSVLRVLDWIFNSADAALLNGYRSLSEVERKLLVPARATRNRARRIFLRVAIPDGRVARRYGAVDRVAELRVQFRAESTYATLGVPQRGEQPVSEARAIELLSRLQEHYCALYVAAARDARSEVFEQAFGRVMSAQFRQELLPQGQGLTAKARAVRNSASSLRNAGEREAASVWASAQEYLRGVFAPEASFGLSLDADRLMDFLVSKVAPAFSFGEHDAAKVPVDQLGAGTQSVLAMALTQLSMADAERKLLLLEEPEAFLHPSAQRTLAWQILQPSEAQLVATTHSSFILAEAEPSDVVVLRNHAVHPASEVSDIQEAKDRYQLSTWVSGSMFDRSLLLVEGPGDLAFFESLRRKLEGIVPIPVLSRVRVAAVGGKTGFGPWLRLLRRYREPGSGSLAFNVMVCSDSADAGADLVRAFRESSIPMSGDVQAAIRSILQGVSGDSIARSEAADIAARTRQVNQLSETNGMPAHFMPVDLEYAATSELSDARASEFADSHGLGAVVGAASLAARLGSKGGEGSPSNAVGAKAPFLRSELALFLDWPEVSPDLKALLWRWVLPAFDGSPPARPPELR